MSIRTPSGGDDPLAPLLEAWFEAVSLGREITLEEICLGCPEHLPRLRLLLDRQADLLEPPRARRSQEVAPGTVLGGFELLAELGSGGMGDVFEAWDPLLKRRVAVKVLRGDASRDAIRHLRFRREAEVTAALDHPNIVPVYATGEDGGHVFLAMKLLRGRGLDANQEPMSGKEAARLLAPVARALHAAHTAGVVHRDIKPGNIVVDDGVPYVLDFGLARANWNETLTHEGQIPGTVPYMAPEQLRGDAHAQGPNVDIYALGATLYQLLSGDPPFKAPSAAGLVHRILTQDAPSLALGRSDRDLEVIASRALEKEPHHRFPTALAFAQDLEAYVEGRPIVSRTLGFPSRLARKIGRHPLAFAATMVFVLVITTMAFLLTYETSRQRDASLAKFRGALDRGRFFEAQREVDTLEALGCSHETLADLRARLETTLDREQLLDQLQADLRVQDSATLEALDARVGRGHREIIAEPLTRLVRELLEWSPTCPPKDTILLDPVVRGAFPRTVATLDACALGRDPVAALSEGALVGDGRPKTRTRQRADDHVLASVVLRLSERPWSLVFLELEKALEIHPGHARARLGRAQGFISTGELEVAEEILLGLLGDEPTPNVHGTLAHLYRIKGDLARARNHLDQALAHLSSLARDPLESLDNLHLETLRLACDEPAFDRVHATLEERWGSRPWLHLQEAYVAAGRGNDAVARRAFLRAAEPGAAPWHARRATLGLLQLDLRVLVGESKELGESRPVDITMPGLRQRVAELAASARSSADPGVAAHAYLALHVLEHHAERPDRAERALDCALEAEPLDPQVNLLAADRVYRALRSPPEETDELIGLGGLSQRTQERIDRVVARRWSDTDAPTRAALEKLLILRVGLALKSGSREAALRAGALAAELLFRRRAPEGDVSRNQLESLNALLGGGPWPAAVPPGDRHR